MDHTHWTDYLDDDGLMWGIEVILVGYTPPLPATRADPSEPWDCTVAQTTAKCEDGTRVEQAQDGDSEEMAIAVHTAIEEAAAEAQRWC